MRSESLTKNMSNLPEDKTPELQRLEKKTKSITNIANPSKSASSTFNLRDQGAYRISASKESLDSLDTDYTLQSVVCITSYSIARTHTLSRQKYLKLKFAPQVAHDRDTYTTSNISP